jgi:hypothetical protein
MSNKDARSSENDRRSEPNSADEKAAYTGPEKRSGSERRKWVNRIDEIRSKV